MPLSLTCVNISNGSLLEESVQLEQFVISWLLLQILHLGCSLIELLE